MAAYIYWLKCTGLYLEDTVMKYLDSAAGAFKGGVLWALLTVKWKKEEASSFDVSMSLY